MVKKLLLGPLLILGAVSLHGQQPAPGRKSACIAGMIEANDIAVRVLQVGFPPKPDLVFRRLVEIDSQLAQPLIRGI